ncbi:uncharacterized protein [Dermacentor andersoni]|uniref:uncharacterized protein n=1 Tax=Dermacentor andersoni TaxID=34620 RepID=UPI00215596EA|nr:uncharacterized protein LOC126524569 [Dermacentor andersoni]
MGNASRKTGELPDEASGMTENQKNLIRSTWRTFCNDNREYGVLMFLSLFVKHPELLPMFRNFRSKHVATLKDDPAFRAHGCAVGYHLTSMVENLTDPATFEVLVRRNATEHLRRKGVTPHHFELMGECVVGVLQAKEERIMTPAAVEAWKKFLSYMVAIIKDVFDKAAAERGSKQAPSSTERFSADIMDEAGLTASVCGTETSNVTASSRGGASKSEPKAEARHGAAPGQVASPRSGPEKATAGSPPVESEGARKQGVGAAGAKKDAKSRKASASPRERATSLPQGEKSGTAEKAASSRRDKSLPEKSAKKTGATEEKGAPSPKGRA